MQCECGGAEVGGGGVGGDGNAEGQRALRRAESGEERSEVMNWIEEHKQRLLERFERASVPGFFNYLMGLHELADAAECVFRYRGRFERTLLNVHPAHVARVVAEVACGADAYVWWVHGSWSGKSHKLTVIYCKGER